MTPPTPPIPMTARPLLDPPDPITRMVPVIATKATPVWLCSIADRICHTSGSTWHLNPGEPGQPEPLEWKRHPRNPLDSPT